MLPLALALAAAVPLITAAQDARPAPFGDRLVRYADATARPGGTLTAPDEPRLRIEGKAVHAYDRNSGRTRWSHSRDGRRPLALLPAPGHAAVLWDDGLVTDTEHAGDGGVRWHRAIPGGAKWLRGHGADGVLRALDPAARMIAVVTPERITAYRSADGDLRWVLPARRGCGFAPERAVRGDGAWLIAQPCADESVAWSAQMVAVDDLGRIAPKRRPMGNALPGPKAAAR
ncbi:hypothetical protein H9Y04_04595 [Streptomyces sp. TRM66268-LWL]|uniref:Uncharacterized protein n=1 Tax=Streptomyces polyasparticus TaxID=2767826 RepID=A0ABR7SBY4_9ACTN|nr:hypothetical protein [Streptomyces polyasparticus]